LPFELSLEEGNFLIQLARNAVKEYLKTGKTVKTPENTPLVEAVIDSAISAATRDPRFYPLSLSELGKVVFEVSVLTPPEAIEVKKPEDYVAKIKVGEDGLIMEKGVFKGLLLPQVPVEWGWCEEEFLCHCCVKAGLQPDSWLTKGAKIYKFQAIIFEEEKPQGEAKCLQLSEK
jgi:uncharacterized protein (TIGR00296 family)